MPDHVTLRRLGIFYSYKKDYSTAIWWFERSLEISNNDPQTLLEKGIAISDQGDYNQAIDIFENLHVILDNESDKGSHEWNCFKARIYRSLAITYCKIPGKETKAIDSIKSAVELDGKWIGEFGVICKSCGHNPRDIWSTIPQNKRTLSSHGDTTRLENLTYLITFLQGGSENKGLASLKDDINAQKSEFLNVIRRPSRLPRDKSLLFFLRKWNSYTPAIPNLSNDSRSVGGGYFLWHRNRGTVIDPGYNFLENFYQAGCSLSDIDNIVITHAHDDHTSQFEQLLTLLHQYNSGQKQYNEWNTPKKVSIFINPGAFSKMSGMVDLYNTSTIERFYTLDSGMENYRIGDGLRLTALPAYHDELHSRDKAVGLLFFVACDGNATAQEKQILFTSDTGLFPLLPKNKSNAYVSDVSDINSEIWRQYLKFLKSDTKGLPYDGIEDKLQRIDLMVLHIGSIKESELFERNPSTRQAIANTCYPNHLGIIGVYRLLAMCHPRVGVISEWGEELKHYRMKVVSILEELLKDPHFYEEDSHDDKNSIVVPGDVALIYDIHNESFFDCVSWDWESIKNISFAPVNAHDPNDIFYFHKDRYNDYLKNSPRIAKTFLAMQEIRRDLYFESEH